MGHKNMQGVGLIELLLVVALLAAMSVGVLWSVQRGVAQQQLGLSMRQLGQTVQFAQAEAKRLGRSVWLCPVQRRVDGRINGCVRQLSEDMWAQGLLVYADKPSLNAGVYDAGEVVRTAFVEEGRHRLQVRQWREQTHPQRFMLLPLAERQPQIRYGAWGWGEREPVWLQLQLSVPGQLGRCETLLMPPTGPPQRCQDDSGGAREVLCQCF
ncbi:GspH/FimT family pseudopilin [Neisseriaceae bacterium CLB008]